MDVADLVRAHYGGTDLETVILAGLTAAGVDTNRLTYSDLGAVDQLHAGYVGATRYLFEQLDLSADTRLLDVGCGIGGPARLAAAEFGCPVIGVDLSPDFVRVARQLTERVGLSELVEHRQVSAESNGLPSGSMDRAVLIHVGMNIPDKAAVFADGRRVLRPDGLFGLYEQMRIADGPVVYPLPWAEDERSSFVESADDYARHLEAAGFTVERVEDRTAATGRPGPPEGPNPAAVFGPAFVERIGNNIAATRAGVLAPVVMIARAT